MAMQASSGAAAFGGTCVVERQLKHLPSNSGQTLLLGMASGCRRDDGRRDLLWRRLLTSCHPSPSSCLDRFGSQQGRRRSGDLLRPVRKGSEPDTTIERTFSFLGSGPRDGEGGAGSDPDNLRAWRAACGALLELPGEAVGRPACLPPRPSPWPARGPLVVHLP